MKSLFLMAAVCLAISCGDSNEQGDGSHHDGSDASSTPSAIDTVQHPNGVTGGSVISTDTAAMRVDSTQR